MSKNAAMNVLAFNPGSNSLKFEIVASESTDRNVVRGKKLLSGVVEPIGPDAKFTLLDGRKKRSSEEFPVADYGNAARKVLDRITSGIASENGIGSASDIDIIGHRVVHGGELYSEPVLIEESVVQEIKKLEELAPLHNASALSVIRAIRTAVRSSTPQVAVFDTAFHRTIPDRARLYPIPWELSERHGIQRFGFHGISHHYLMLRYAELTATPVEKTNIISLHLEGGSSATAIVNGRSIDTSMGFTPLEGLMMGTRCGDIDPALVGFLERKEGLDSAGVEKLLNKQSGLLGVSGRSQDTRELVPHESEKRVGLALDMFAYRVRKYVGAYLAAAGNTSAIVFGGGIGENTPVVRQRVCGGLESLGLLLDPDRNAATIDHEGKISRDGSVLQVFVIPTEEALMIAHQAVCAVVSR
ncbi:MAG TPA: acetate/propionate family kinase [Bryobacteraceae bacterium]|jgi:acetate kinase|nr:acetate/propionate family kinase [Bryobacteraceae bacterium]